MNFKCSGSYKEFPNWVKNKKTTKNPVRKNDNKCFQYPVSNALNHSKIKKKILEGISKTKPFISKYNWEGVSYPSEKIIGKHLGKTI